MPALVVKPDLLRPEGMVTAMVALLAGEGGAVAHGEGGSWLTAKLHGDGARWLTAGVARWLTAKVALGARGVDPGIGERPEVLVTAWEVDGEQVGLLVARVLPPSMPAGFVAGLVAALGDVPVAADVESSLGWCRGRRVGGAAVDPSWGRRGSG